MSRMGPKLIAVGTVVVTIAGIEFVRDRAPDEAITEERVVQLAPPPANSPPDREAPRPIEEVGDPIQGTQTMARDADSPGGAVALIPREVAELSANSPVLAPAIESSEAELGREARDSAWAPAMETQILSEISNKALGIEISGLQVDCRTTICRIQMLFPQPLLQKPVGVVPEETAWDGHQPVGFFIKALDLNFRQPVASGLDDSGTPVVIGYVNRPPAASQ